MNLSSMTSTSMNLILRSMAISALCILTVACGVAEPAAAPVDLPAVEEIGETADAVGEGEEAAATDADHDHDADADHDHDDVQAYVAGLDLDLFFDGALAEEVTIQDCTLADGTETRCYAITIAGYPANHEVGPFCPDTTATLAEEAGIWFDGNGVYDLDGAFILGLADLYGDSNWKLYDDDGNVYITDTPEAFEAAARPDVDPAYQNHCVEGRMEWLENGEPVQTTVLIPVIPVVGDGPTPAGGNLGVTLNGVIIAASAPVDAILSAYTIAAFDDCGGHINPVDGYHLHGARGCSEVGEAVDGETPIFAYAMDGYPIHSPLDEAAEAAAELDACQGHSTEVDGYHYHAASVEENAILSCTMGVTVEQAGRGAGGGPPGGGPPGGGPGGAAPAAEPLAAPVEPEPAPTTSFQLEAWADNWFAAYAGEELIVEDSVPITTERSFNAETVTFEAGYPLHLNVILKDFKENDTGLEYIGSNRQQMGDGGFIMQLTDLSAGAVVAVSNAQWACTVIHEAPLDKACETESNPVAGTAPCEFVDLGEPEGWKAADYDDSAWTATTVHPASAVDPKGGYDEVAWDASAELIWGPDLETDNTLLCRVTIAED